MYSSQWPSRIAGCLGFLAVALGAFGAHGLKELLTTRNSTALWDKAVLFHLVHAIMLWAVSPRDTRPCVAWWLFLWGIVFFSGSLYGLAITKAAWLGPLTPLGGLCLLSGWMWLAVKPARFPP